MSNTSITGKFLGVLPVQAFPSGFTIQKFYLDITDNPEYPAQAEFQISKGRVDVSRFPIGTDITVSFNIRGKKATKQDGTEAFYQNLDAWKVEQAVQAAPVAAPLPVAYPPAAPVAGYPQPAAPIPTAPIPAAPAPGYPVPAQAPLPAAPLPAAPLPAPGSDLPFNHGV